MDAICQAAECDFGIDIIPSRELNEVLAQAFAAPDEPFQIDTDTDGSGLFVTHGSSGYALCCDEEGDKYSTTWVKVEDITESFEARRFELKKLNKVQLVEMLLKTQFNS